ncbi:MAG: glycosyltransferase [Patescibacteria group bacterium]
MTNWPKVSLTMFTLNGGKGVERCLESVRKQVYPKDKIEIIVIDNNSTDDSVDIAKKYTNKIVVNSRDGYLNRAEAMRMATGDFVFMILEQDIELRSKYFLQKMVSPLIKDERLVASFTRDYPRRDQPWVTRFISYHPIQCDPLFEYLTPSLESTIVEKKQNYFICKFIEGKTPPVTHMLFRVSALKKSGVWEQERDADHDTVIKLIKFGYNLFAYVPDAGDYHYHAKNLKELIRKRIRNLNRHYFIYHETTQYKWVDINNKQEVIKMIIWILYANSLIFPAIRGFIRFIKYKDWALLLEPVIAVSVTDVLLWTFLRNKAGRKIITNSLRSLILK